MADEFKNKATATFLAGLTNISVTSNEVVASLSNGTIALTKSQTLDIIYPQSIQEYTITGVSTVGIGVTLFTLTDIIPSGLSYVDGSFKVDGVAKVPTIVGNILTYIYGAWADGTTHTFSFQCVRS